MDQPNLRTLSFVDSSPNKVDIWPPFRTTGSYAGDCQAGRERADEVLDFMRQVGDPCIIGYVVQAIVASGSYGGLEIGFFGQIGGAVIAVPQLVAVEPSPVSVEPTNVIPFAARA